MLSGHRALSSQATAEGEAHYLLREPLLARLAQADDARLVLVRAPTGFGKTILLRQYRQRCQAQGRSTLWLDVGGVENSLGRFVLALSRLLREQGLALPEQADVGLASHELLAGLALHGGPIDIFLDEFEELQAPAALQFVQQLLDVLPEGGRLVIASQVTPDIGIARIRARGELLELTPRMLRFSLQETGDFLRHHCALVLEDVQLVELQRATEGWGVALAMAAMAMGDREDPAGFIASFVHAGEDLAAYLVQSVVARLAPERQHLLRCASLLETFDAALCGLLCDGDGQEGIDFLLRSNLFIYPADDQQRWFRFHRLFARYLSAAFERHAPEEVALLRRKAADWYFRHGMPARGLDQLLAAGAMPEAALRLRENLQSLYAAGHTRRMLRWLERLPEGLRVEPPELEFAYGWAALFNRRYDEVQRIVERRAGDLHGQTLRLILLAVHDRVEEACELGRALLPCMEPTGGFESLAVANTFAYALLSCGHYEEARKLLSASVLRGAAGQAGVMGTVAVNAESIIDLVQGRFAGAAARLQGFRGQAAAEERLFGGKVPLEVLHALTLYERNELMQAQRQLGENLPLAMDSGPADTLILACILLARLAWVRGDRALWNRYLNELERQGREAGRARVLAAVGCERARLATLDGRLEAAAQALGQAERFADWDRPGVIFLGTDDSTPRIARLRLRIAQGQAVAAAGDILQALAEAEHHGHRRRALKLRQLLALALAAQGRQEAAFDALSQALRMAGDERLLRSFLDEGRPLGELLQRWALKHQARASGLGIASAYLADLLTAFAAEGNGQAEEAQDVLTGRELEVLRWSAQGLPIPQIAQGMDLSEHTVKTHLRNLNAKLGAHGRTQAVAIARARGLIA